MVEQDFRDTEASLSDTVRRLMSVVQADQITIRELLHLTGEQGLLTFSIILTLPFLLPVSIPGVSTVFGLVLILIGIGVTFNRLPWLPDRLMDRKIKREHLLPVLEKGLNLFNRLERWVRPRLARLTTGATANLTNGLVFTLAGVLLLFPLSFIPFSNTLPALAILLLALGMLQRDGYMVMAGYVAVIATILYFGGLAVLVLMGGQTLMGM
jgi:hypothetical protein